MIETGHFAELDNIIRLTLKQSESGEISTRRGAFLTLSFAEKTRSSRKGKVLGMKLKPQKTKCLRRSNYRPSCSLRRSARICNAT